MGCNCYSRQACHTHTDDAEKTIDVPDTFRPTGAGFTSIFVGGFVLISVRFHHLLRSLVS
ncbi:hypothetical protein BDZ94DRAFT_1251191 [Collybia nuda]|uniref:Uncharacterized protein n=1 Tax=Collybia nuda TaxID=64659 RepID=A0A9P6CHT7_9AGAR|nr:hypothetical protein BDZ94DRAFT_1251191 [Collybia nuda]